MRYLLPDPSLLDPPNGVPKPDSRYLLQMAKTIEEKCADFQAAGKVESVHPGPVVFTFEFIPAERTRLHDLFAARETLAAALKVEAIGFGRVPGKEAVAIEIPNPQRETIPLRWILEADTIRESESPAILALGTDIRGVPVLESLATIQHLLIASGPGQGLSNLLDSIIMGILFKATPDDVKLLLIDSKGIEFSRYEDLPHLCTPIITNAQRAAAALKWALSELEVRSRKFKEVQARNIQQYQKTILELGRNEKFPYIVILLDEVANLQYQLQDELRDLLYRLARASHIYGLHLIVTAQNPSSLAFASSLRTFFPSRISLKGRNLESSEDADAEELLGNGDMFLYNTSSPHPRRLHAPLVSPQEISRVVRFLKAQQRPGNYDPILALQTMHTKLDNDLNAADPLFREAIRLTLTTKIASATFLQRKLRTGYAKSSRYLDIMEENGWIGPAQGANPREILLSKEQIERLFTDLERDSDSQQSSD